MTKTLVVHIVTVFNAKYLMQVKPFGFQLNPIQLLRLMEGMEGPGDLELQGQNLTQCVMLPAVTLLSALKMLSCTCSKTFLTKVCKCLVSKIPKSVKDKVT